MNRFYILFLLCLTFNSVKADWDLFPLNQKSYYSIPYPGYERINLVAFDSIVQGSTYQSVFANRKNSGVGLSRCYDEVTQYFLSNAIWINPEFDSLIYSGDTIIFSPQLYFLPQINPGESWRISGPLNNGFTDIEFTCTAISSQIFLGIIDSVKEFTLTTYDGVSLYNSPLSGFVFRLSKNYGLLDYLEFRSLQYHSKEEHNLIGLNDSIANYGFQAPAYLDFFPYKVGDILNWLTETHPWFPDPYTYHYFRDSIISVNITADTLMYRAIRQNFRLPSGVHWTDTIEETHTVDYYKSILELPTNWFSISPRISFHIDISFSESMVLEPDSSISYRINYNGSYVDTSNCQAGQITDDGRHFIYNTNQGHIEYCEDAFYYHCTKRIGSFIDGVLYGDTLLETDIDNISFDNLLGIYPNPASSILCISLSTKSREKSIIEIADLSGSIVYSDIVKLSESTCSKEINIAQFANGFYVLTVSDPGRKKVGRKKFAVQH